MALWGSISRREPAYGRRRAPASRHAPRCPKRPAGARMAPTWRPLGGALFSRPTAPARPDGASALRRPALYTPGGASLPLRR